MNGLKCLVRLAQIKGISTVVMQEDPLPNYNNLFADLNIHKIFDRRSMAYFAMGMAQELKEPVLLFLKDTDDAAVSDILPGITEAYYQNVPVLTITVNNRRDWMKNATTVIGDKCVFNCDITETRKGFSETDIININNALCSLTEVGGGPVFIQYHVVEKSEDGVELPIFESMTQSQLIQNIDDVRTILLNQPIHIILDADANYSTKDIIDLKTFCRKYNASVSDDDVYSATRYLPIKEINEDNLILLFGENHTRQCSYANIKWIVSPKLYIDQSCNVHVRTDWRCFINIVSGETTEKQEQEQENVFHLNYTDQWSFKNILGLIVDSIKQEAWVAGVSVDGINISRYLSPNPNIRSASYMDITGEEGKLSVFVGQSLAAVDKICVCFIDQKNFFRDMNALHIQAIKPNARVVMFGDADGAKKSVAWASSCGFESKMATDMASLSEALNTFSDMKGNRPQLLSIVI